MSIYDEMRMVAKELLGSDDFRQQGIRYVELTKGTGPRENPGPPTEKIHDIVDGVARGVDARYIDGTQVVASDGQVTCGVPQPFTPKVFDWVIVGGQRCKIKQLKPIPPTGVTVAYVMIYER